MAICATLIACSDEREGGAEGDHIRNRYHSAPFAPAIYANFGNRDPLYDVALKGMVIQGCDLFELPRRDEVIRKIMTSSMFSNEHLNRRFTSIYCGEAYLRPKMRATFSFERDAWIVDTL